MKNLDNRTLVLGFTVEVKMTKSMDFFEKSMY